MSRHFVLIIVSSLFRTLSALVFSAVFFIVTTTAFGIGISNGHALTLKQGFTDAPSGIECVHSSVQSFPLPEVLEPEEWEPDENESPSSSYSLFSACDITGISRILSSIEKTRFQQRALLVARQPRIALFVLHHSWRLSAAA